MKQWIGLLWLLVVIVSCSSTKERVPEEREHENIQRDYEVKDSSSNIRPGWVEDAEVWAKSHGKDVDQYRYFSYETEPKRSRGISCDLAKANARADIASEIASFIDKSLASSEEGDASINENSPQLQALRSYVQNTLAEKVQALIHGAAVRKTYWEKRRYLQEKGAAKDFTAYTCAALIRIPSKRLERAIEEAANHVVDRVEDPEAKATVKQALKDASDNFVKAKTGQI